MTSSLIFLFLRLVAAAVLIWGLALLELAARSAPLIAASDVAQPTGGTRTSEAGQVTVSLTWSGDPSDLAFRVVMDTHSVNLDQYDLAQLAVLRTGNGTEVRPINWNAPAGSHHREGTLTFSSADESGSPVVNGDTQSIEIAIRDIAGIPERVFRW